MPNPARRVVYDDFLPNSATVLYTYAGNKNGFAQITFAAFSNTNATGGAAALVTLRIVRSGGTITQARYTLFNEVSLDAAQALWYFEDAGEQGSVDLKDGDQIVAFSDTASVVACRIVVTETNAG